MNGLDIFRLFIYLLVGVWYWIFRTDGLTEDVVASGITLFGIIGIYKFVKDIIRKG